MRKYANSLREKWEREQVLVATSDVQVTENDSAEQDASADELPDQDLLPKLRKGTSRSQKPPEQPNRGWQEATSDSEIEVRQLTPTSKGTSDTN